MGLVFTVLGLLPFQSSAGEGSLLAAASVVLLGVTIAVSAGFPRPALCIAIGFLTVQIGFPFGLSEARDWPVYLGPALVVFFAALNVSSRVRLQGLGAAVVLMVVATLLYGMRLIEAGQRPVVATEAAGSAQASILFWVYMAFEFSILIVGAWLVGFGIRMTIERFTLIRERASTAEVIRQAELKLTVAGERNRISRELHDVLAHSLAVIAAQADGTRYLNKDQPPMVTGALENISSAARSALIDAQRVIENVSADEDCDAPGIEDVDDLINQLRHGHLIIDRTDQGTRQPLTGDQELSIYRIVQESLTNALKHAGLGSEVALRFNWDGPGLTLHITSTPDTTIARGATNEPAAGGGRGISGLRNRVETAGGWLTAEVDGQAFITTAFVPYLTSDAATAVQRASRIAS